MRQSDPTKESGITTMRQDIARRVRDGYYQAPEATNDVLWLIAKLSQVEAERDALRADQNRERPFVDAYRECRQREDTLREAAQKAVLLWNEGANCDPAVQELGELLERHP